jgi:phosphatidylethanolamine-binding protein (PEBP) family uncharacterized protein
LTRNDFGDPGYGGPCPPRGNGTHHYRFRLFAISRPTLASTPPPTAASVLQAAQPYVIEQTQLIGVYQR